MESKPRKAIQKLESELEKRYGVALEGVQRAGGDIAEMAAARAREESYGYAIDELRVILRDNDDDDIERGRRDLQRLQQQYWNRRDYYRVRASEDSAKGNTIGSHKLREFEALVDEFLYYLAQLEDWFGQPEANDDRP